MEGKRILYVTTEMKRLFFLMDINILIRLLKMSIFGFTNKKD